MAAIGKSGFEKEKYKANEDLSASLLVEYKDSRHREQPELRMVTVRPDAAASLHEEWDVLGMIEWKPEGKSS